MRTRSLRVCAFSAALAAPLAHAEPDGRALLQRSAEACRAVQTVEYRVEQFVPHDGQLHLVVRADVVQARSLGTRSAGHGGGLYRAEGQIFSADEPPRPFAWAYDGERLRILAPEEQAVLFVERPTEADAGRSLGWETGLVTFSQFITDEPFGQMLAPEAEHAYLGEEEVSGVRCHIIEVRRRLRAPDGVERESVAVFGLGVDDLLPRLFRTKSHEKRVIRLRTNIDVADDRFVLAAPAGYAERSLTGGRARTEGLLPVGSEAPGWTLTDADGRETSLEDLRGDFVLLDFWGTWCFPCRKAIPGLERLHQRFRDQGLVVLGVSVNEPEGADPASALRDLGATYRTLLNGEPLLPRYKVPGFPTLYLLSPEGAVLHAEFGFRDGAEADIAAILGRELARRAH